MGGLVRVRLVGRVLNDFGFAAGVGVLQLSGDHSLAFGRSVDHEYDLAVIAGDTQA